MLIVWIAVELAFIRQFSWLQPFYLGVGVTFVVIGRRVGTQLRSAAPARTRARGIVTVFPDRSRKRGFTGAALVATSVYVALHWLGRTYGSTREERAAALPGDNVVADPHLVTTHAISIGSPPERVWPWLVQMGWHRGGWYTARWVDQLLFPNNGPSADRIVTELQHLELGDFVPDGPPETECGFVVEALDVNRSLVLHSTTHLPLSWRERSGAQLDWSWAFILQPLDRGQRTRFLFPYALPACTVLGSAGLPGRDRARGFRHVARYVARREASSGMRRVRKTLYIVLSCLLGAFLLIQLVPYRVSNPSTRREPKWDSPRTRELAVAACYDCHSNQTKSEWYSNIAPVSWWIKNHVDEGRSALNFSEWPDIRGEAAARRPRPSRTVPCRRPITPGSVSTARPSSPSPSATNSSGA